MSPHCVWLVILGGYEWLHAGRGLEKPIDTLITDTNKLIMIVELGNIHVIIKITLYITNFFLIINFIKNFICPYFSIY